ncbi:nitrate reductase molybdenum cofactor assembly chaperone [Marinicaulis aureus]|uniref:Nitrate reductase molybdenum cofactor assembly chaperone n=1 Tax=Hyphococcus aureus TaxID=2666033 RepID=A0ABW1L2W4_9PROT
MSNTYKAMSALLSYPTQEIKDAAVDIRKAMHDENLAPGWALRQVDRLIDDYEALDLYELQERYVFLFDRTRSLSLHLFEHVHGESRDRGQAMVDLKTLYAQGGLEIGSNELPDFLPLFLEYLSTRSAEEAKTLLNEPLSVIAALKERLEKRNTPYTAVFRALEAIAGETPSVRELNDLRKAPDDDPHDLEALDAAWEDQPVTFGPEDAGCPKVTQMLDRMNAGEAPGDIARIARS